MYPRLAVFLPFAVVVSQTLIKDYEAWQEIPFQQYPISFDVASRGVGTQFDRSSPVGCNSESVNLPTKDEAESILSGAIRARGGPLSSLLKISG